MYLKYRAKPVCPRLLAPSFRSISLINTKKELKTHLTNARRRRAEERGILKGERIAKNSAGRSLFNHQPFCRVLKHLSPLSGASLVRFLPTRARNEHPLRFLPTRARNEHLSHWIDILSFLVRGSKVFSPLNRPRISLCDEKQICCKVNLAFLQFWDESDNLQKSFFKKIHKTVDKSFFVWYNA